MKRSFGSVRDRVMAVLGDLNIYDVAVQAFGRGNGKAQLRKVAGEDTYRVLCPFHNERTPSFLILSEVNGAACLGCGMTIVSPVEFILKYHGDKSYEKILDAISKTDPNLSKSVLEEEAFNSQEEFWNFVYDRNSGEKDAVLDAMENSLHCRAYLKKYSPYR